MSDYKCHIEGCDWSGDSPAGLRSHVSGVKDNDHQEARRAKAWEGWYPETFGVVDPSEGEGSDRSDADPDDDTQDDPAESSDDGGDATPANRGPDPADEYEEQWGSDGSDGSTQEGIDDDGDDPADDPTDDDDTDGSAPSDAEGSDAGAAATLVAGSLVVGLIVLLTRGSDDDEPVEVESEAEDIDPDQQGATEPIEGQEVWE